MSVTERIEELREAMHDLEVLYIERDELVRIMNAKMIRENELMAKIRRINLDIVRED